MLAVGVLLTVLNASDAKDQISLLRGSHAWELEWSDAEDRLRGAISPLDPLASEPMQVSLRVGTFQGPDFDGPLTVSLRCPGWSETQTLARAPDEKAWLARFRPQDTGDCHLDVGWQTTRHKLVHATVRVGPAPLSRLPWYVLIGVVSAAALALGVRAALKKPEPA